ncbi:lysophospholipid acyltransferase family protein [Candidatus Magnetaquicoccus inordinatus]|uniref:lysophospholipid acyltransferase family protein n=1 Tax=Candidatus Magnetaquicoccus inordinatus TaxID=2496818 RepID=UPI00102AE27A|nr:lysophospholipid acyltransferase family protein [Candidatus Magnetaquicoccus inordinatus]
MKQHINRLWRFLGTMFAFAALGLGGPFIAIILYPILMIVQRNTQQRNQFFQTAIHYSFRLYIAMLQVLRLLTLKVENKEYLHTLRGTVIVATHPTLLDIVILISLIPKVQCIVKGRLWRNPFLYPMVAGAGYIRNDLAPEEVVTQCVSQLHLGNNLIIFPQGTRTPPSQPVALKRGFATIAIQSGSPVQLIDVTCDPITLTKETSWYSIPLRPPVFEIKIGEFLHTESYSLQPVRSLAIRALTAKVASSFDIPDTHE